MQEVKIYINTYHSGNFKTGTGTYTVILEYNSEKYGIRTKDIIDGYTGTSKQRIALLACITALKRMKRPCEINLIINSEYVVNAINDGNWIMWMETGKNSKGNKVKNLDLWQQLYNLAMIHETEFIHQEKNAYTDNMLWEMRRRKIDLKEDRNEDNMQPRRS